MSTKTAIEWTDATWNPVTGCTKVSEGCAHCYAETWAGRHLGEFSKDKARKFTDVRTHADKLTLPLSWSKPRRIFVNSMSDLFHRDVPDAFIRQVFEVMASAHRHTFQILTKRPERMNRFLSDLKVAPLPHVWLGTSVEDQRAADDRVPQLVGTPARVRFLSCEPLLGPVDLSPWFGGLCGIDWVIVGGESGPKARPMHPQWARALRDQCASAGVAFFFKQWGDNMPMEHRGGVSWVRVGKKAAGRLLDGCEHNAMPR